MSKEVIKVENLSKLYRLGEVNTGMLSHDLQRVWAKMRGKEYPFRVIGTENDRSVKDDSKYAWALKDIDFTINAGDTVGVIGKNGAGKSTLLKVLSRVTSPTTGNVRIRGRISSLLEVGTGFHPELTGRENIFLNGAILGMTKREIAAKFDEIVDFSGVERYIDTPVKRYSSGMYVRLAFAVAAHLEPEILIVDEVLAVGDAEFQKKCLGKMKDVSSHGRTILFVSHNMGAVRSLCAKGILLKNGRVDTYDSIDKVVTRYYTNVKSKSRVTFESDDRSASSPEIGITSIEVLGNINNGMFSINQELVIKVTGVNRSVTEPVNINLFFNADDGTNIFTTCSHRQELAVGEFEALLTVPDNFMNDNSYFVDAMLVVNGQIVKIHLKEVLMIEGLEPTRKEGWMGKFPGLIKPKFNWQINNVKCIQNSI